MRSPFNYRFGLPSPFYDNETGFFSPASLFAFAEPGVWFDPSDVANLNWRYNLLTWTDDLRNTAETGSTRPWTISAGSSSVTANYATAPDGANTASRITFTASDYPGRQQNYQLAAGSTYTFSVYIKRISGPNTGRLEIYGLGVATSIASINATSAWTRVSVTATATASGTAGAYIYPEYSPGVTGEYYLWGAQLELGSVATTYQPITDVNTEVVQRFPYATLYQDNLGVTAVTTPGQTVGLMLDKSKGLVLGPDVVVNGDFSSGTTDWLGFGAGTGWNVTDGKAVHTAGTYGTIRKDTTLLPLVAGKSYLMTFSLSGRTTSSVYAYGGGVLLTTAPISANQEYRYIFTAIATGTMVGFEANTAFDGSIDNVSIKEIPGNHATQTTPAARPIYAIEPAGGRRNLLLYSEQFDVGGAWFKDSSGAPVPTVTANFGIAPDGTNTADRLQMDKTGGVYTRIAQTITIPSSIYTGSVWMKNNAAGTANVGLRMSAEGINCAVTGTWQRFSVSVPAAETTASFQILLFDSIPGNDETADILVWGAQLELGSTATPYQKVTTQYDVTQTGKATMSYLYFDGVNDSMVTSTITPGIDKVQLFTGLRKLGTGRAMVAELSTVFTNPGTFGSEVDASGTGTYRIVVAGTPGTSYSDVSSPPSYFSPSTNVVTSTGNIAGDLTVLRVNSAQVGQSTADLGTGNFSAYPLYLGARGGSSLFFTGHLYSQITRFGATLPDTTITSTEGWVAGKTGFYQPIITGVPTIGVS